VGRQSELAKAEMPQAEIELALAWLRGEADLAAIAAARGKFHASNSLAWVGPRLKEAWRRGMLDIKEDAAHPTLGEGGDENCN